MFGIRWDHTGVLCEVTEELLGIELCEILQSNNTNQREIVLSDMKGVELSFKETVPHLGGLKKTSVSLILGKAV